MYSNRASKPIQLVLKILHCLLQEDLALVLVLEEVMIVAVELATLFTWEVVVAVIKNPPGEVAVVLVHGPNFEVNA